MRLPSIAVSAVALAMFFGSPEVKAFTFEGQSGNNSDGGPRIAEPDEGQNRLADPESSFGPPGTNGPTYTVRPSRSDGRFGQPPRRIHLPASTHPDDHHLFWGNSRHR
jgi:hypothetical protein